LQKKEEDGGEAALLWAVQQGHVDVIQELIAAGAGPRDSNNWTQLTLTASQAGHLDVVKALLAHKGDNTPLAPTTSCINVGVHDNVAYEDSL